MAILYNSNSERLSEILTEPISNLFSVTLVYVDEQGRTGFERNIESKQNLIEIVGSDIFVWHPKDKVPIFLSDNVDSYILKKAGGPCLVFSNANECFRSQVDRLKQVNKEKVKARLKKIEFDSEIPLLRRLFTDIDRKLDCKSLLSLSSMCEYLTIWRFGDLGLYCHLISCKELPEHLLIGATKVAEFPEW